MKNNPSQHALNTHRNHYLFSDYYLDNRLGEQPEWATDVSPTLAGFTALWRSYNPQADNESQTEADWIRPVLEKLGHTFNVQVAPATEREAIGELAMQLTEIAKARYQLHRQSRHRILADLGTPEGADKLNQKLTAWWDLDFSAFRGEVKKIFKQDIPLKERDEWEAWLLDRQAKHRQHTGEIVRLETDLNARVYGLFNLTPAEIALIEESTKYRYGEV